MFVLCSDQIIMFVLDSDVSTKRSNVRINHHGQEMIVLLRNLFFGTDRFPLDTLRKNGNLTARKHASAEPFWPSQQKWKIRDVSLHAVTREQQHGKLPEHNRPAYSSIITRSSARLHMTYRPPGRKAANVLASFVSCMGPPKVRSARIFDWLNHRSGPLHLIYCTSARKLVHQYTCRGLQDDRRSVRSESTFIADPYGCWSLLSQPLDTKGNRSNVLM